MYDDARTRTGRAHARTPGPDDPSSDRDRGSRNLVGRPRVASRIVASRSDSVSISLIGITVRYTVTVFVVIRCMNV